MLEIICDGTNAFIFDVEDEGQVITLSGWNTRIRNLENGTELLISTDGGKTGSGYTIISNANPMYPKDQYFLKCKFKLKDS